jgi:hypothetical protein
VRPYDEDDAPSVAPEVSVVVPTYQRRELVRRAVASVAAQTFEDLEIIVVDDGSTDGTRGALAGFDRRLRYAWQPNRGVSAARNAGIRLARGAVVAFLDSDDFWLRDHLAVVTEVLARHPDAVLCTTSVRFHVGGRQPPSAAEVVDALPALLVENIVGCPSGVAVRREPLLSAGAFDERLRVMEGWDLWLRLARLGPIATLHRRTFVYQATRGSLTERSSRTGEYLRALSTVARTAVAVAADVRNDAPELRRRAAGLRAYFDALRALTSRDEAGARASLAEACAGLPELSSEPQLVANRLALLRFGPEERLRSFAAAASCWPDPTADTPLYLRMHAFTLALRLGRLAEATALMRGWPLAATPRFLARNTRVLGRLILRSAQKLLHHGRDSPLPEPAAPQA